MATFYKPRVYRTTHSTFQGDLTLALATLESVIECNKSIVVKAFTNAKLDKSLNLFISRDVWA